VSDVDIYFVYKNLLAGIQSPQKLLDQERSTSALVYNWGVKKEFEQLGLHNFFFAKEYKKEFNALFNDKTIPDDPSIYLFISSKHIKSDAPQGCENWFTLVNAPANKNLHWDPIVTTTRKHVINKLNRILNVDIEPYIECEKVLGPIDIELNTSSYQGSLYGSSSNSKWSAFLRHSNKSHQIKNLYFVGGSVHPGGGIPLCLASAKIVDQWIKPVTRHDK
jgi:phytoene dehydrogenase-like protein